MPNCNEVFINGTWYHNVDRLDGQSHQLGTAAEKELSVSPQHLPKVRDNELTSHKIALQPRDCAVEEWSHCDENATRQCHRGERRGDREAVGCTWKESLTSCAGAWTGDNAVTRRLHSSSIAQSGNFSVF